MIYENITIMKSIVIVIATIKWRMRTIISVNWASIDLTYEMSI